LQSAPIIASGQGAEARRKHHRKSVSKIERTISGGSWARQCCRNNSPKWLGSSRAAYPVSGPISSAMRSLRRKRDRRVRSDHNSGRGADAHGDPGLACVMLPSALSLDMHHTRTSVNHLSSREVSARPAPSGKRSARVVLFLRPELTDKNNSASSADECEFAPVLEAVGGPSAKSFRHIHRSVATVLSARSRLKRADPQRGDMRGNPRRSASF
jgi:hypothetical protein